MKKVGAIVIATSIFLFVSGIFLTLPGKITNDAPALVSFESFTLEKLTIYNPTTDQCDADPFVTASNQKINPGKLRSGAIRWMAVSRDMLKRWGGNLNYGDTVMIYTGDSAIDGEWVIQDTMNKRFKNRGDLLFDSQLRTTGVWSNVTLQKRKVYSIGVDGDPLADV